MRIMTVLLTLLTGCAGAVVAPSETSHSDQAETFRNSKCLDSSKMKVFQVLDGGVLAYLCPTTYPSIYEDAFEACYVKGDTVFMAVKPADNDYVDEQKVSLDSDKCFTADGTYSYSTRDELRKRVRKIKIINSQTPSLDNEAGKKR